MAITPQERQEALEKRIENAYAYWRKNKFQSNLEKLLDVTCAVISSYSEEHTENLRNLAFRIILITVKDMANENIVINDPAHGALVKSLLKNGNWQKFIVQPDGDYLFACLLLDYADRAYDSFECPRTSLVKTVSEWTGHTLNFKSECTPKTIGPVTRRDLANHLFGDAWTMLYNDEHDRFLTYQYKIVLNERPPFAFGNNSNSAKVNVDIAMNFYL